MAKPNNKDKNPKIDESILEQDPPNINEPQATDDDPENQDPNPDPEPTADPEPEPAPEPEGEEGDPGEEPDPEVDETPAKKVEKKPAPAEEPEAESDEQKEQRYKAQQTESQIQSARNKALLDKIDQSSQIKEPTVDEMKSFVAQEGADWDDLTPFEQATQKRLWKSEQRDQLLNEAVLTTRKIDEWAGQVDTYIDSTDGKPEFIELSGHESDFRKYCMAEAHRGTPIDVLLSAFLHNLPPVQKKRGKLFETTGGGEKDTNQGKITDADQLATLRTSNPREYRRAIKGGKVALDV